MTSSAEARPSCSEVFRAPGKERRADVCAFWHRRSGSVQYIVSDPSTGSCAIIDPVLDFDERSGSFDTSSADALLAHVAQAGLQVSWILDTHPHADHVTAAAYLRGRTGAPMAIGAHVRDVQTIWRAIYNLPSDFAADGSQWDRLWTEGDRFAIGSLDCEVWFSPGHTAASVSYLVGDAAFVHDTLLMPDLGTARADFPGACPHALWTSIERILSLPDATRLFIGHDYPPASRPAGWESDVRTQRAANIHLCACRGSAEAFVTARRERDRTLPLPSLMLMALQMNIRGGRPPDPETDGRRYLKIPLDQFPDSAAFDP